MKIHEIKSIHAGLLVTHNKIHGLNDPYGLTRLFRVNRRIRQEVTKDGKLIWHKIQKLGVVNNV